MTPHSLWSEILEITADAKRVDADLLVALGAGTLTDAAKIIATVDTLQQSSVQPALTLTGDGE